METFEKRIGYVFQDKVLLALALCHPSFANACVKKTHNQRLEFLGDAVLGQSVSAYLYHAYPNENEGSLTQYRASLVCTSALAKKAKALGLEKYVVLGPGGKKQSINIYPSVLADALEALIGAIYLDGGMDMAQKFVMTHCLGTPVKNNYFSYKNKLQEFCQCHFKGLPVYTLLSARGEDHQKLFFVEVAVQRYKAQGLGKSKKEAEQNAARKLLHRVQTV